MKTKEKYGYLIAEIRGNLKGCESFLDSVNESNANYNVVIKAKHEREILQELMDFIKKQEEL